MWIYGYMDMWIYDVLEYLVGNVMMCIESREIENRKLKGGGVGGWLLAGCWLWW